jgi:hypothetical protein
MRFYPLGSSSLNQIYNPTLATTASVSLYAETGSYSIRIVSASHAINGVRGIDGTPGICDPQVGLQGPTGSIGFGGAVGGISIAYPSGSGF